jgi:hypothetical protein
MKSFWLASIAIALCSGEAAAQLGTGRSGHSTSSPLSNVRPYKELQSFGECLARTGRKNALAIVATAPGSREEAKVLKKFVFGEHSNCSLGAFEMRMPDIFARGAIAEGLLRNGGVPAEYRLPAPAPSAVRDLHGAARCYASGHRRDVEKLLQTDPGTPQEVQAVAAIWDGFRTCMPDFKVRLNAPWIRFLLAEALLRVEPGTAAAGR